MQSTYSYLLVILPFLLFNTGCNSNEGEKVPETGEPPSATTLAFEDNLPPKVTFVGLVGTNLATSVSFEYGLTTSYGQSVQAVNSPTTEGGMMRATVNDLTPNGTYHFRLVAENEFGKQYGKDMTFTSAYTIGQKIGHGYVVQVDATGLHGLLGLESYEPASSFSYLGEWCADYPKVTGAIGTELGTGKTNSTLILAAHGSCAKFTHLINKYTFDNRQWAMASKDELDLIYKHIYMNQLGQYARNFYWSSSEASKDSVWVTGLFNGNAAPET